MNTKKRMSMGLAACLMSLALGACSEPLSHREKGALIGGGAGAAGGAIVGGLTGSPGTGALIGGGAGAVGGAIIGDQKDRREGRYD